MDYETFLKFFDTMAKEKTIDIESYLVEFGKVNDPVGVGYTLYIYYFKEGYEIGTDYMHEYYSTESIIPSIDTSYDYSGIKNFDKLIDYLKYLYKSNIERLEKEERQQEQLRTEYLKEEERKQIKLDKFINSD